MEFTLVESEKYHAWGNSYSVLVEKLSYFQSQEGTFSPYNWPVTVGVISVKAALVLADVALHEVRYTDRAYHEKYPDSWCCGKGFS